MFYFMYIPRLLYPFLCWWTFWLLQLDSSISVLMCGRQNNNMSSPKIFMFQFLEPVTKLCYMANANWGCKWHWTGLRRGGLSWIIWVGCMRSQGSLKTLNRQVAAAWGQSDEMWEGFSQCCWLCRWRQRAARQRVQPPLGAGRGKAAESLLEPPWECSPPTAWF